MNRVEPSRIATLAEVCAYVGVSPTPPTTERGAVSVIVDVSHPDHWRFYKLSDYAVSTRSGPLMWLVPTDPAVRAEYLRRFPVVS